MIIEPRCSLRRCKHLIGIIQPDGSELSEVCACAAFPRGIPVDIAYGENLHSEVQPGQVGVYVFEADYE